MHNRWGDTTYRHALLLLASAGLFGCSLFVVDNPQACTDRPQACPGGQSCSPMTGRCQDDTQDNPALDLMMSARDLATLDLANSTPDQASPDLASPRCRAGNATSVGKIGETSPTPNHRIAIGSRAIGAIGRKLSMIGSRLSRTRRLVPISAPSVSAATTARERGLSEERITGIPCGRDARIAGQGRRGWPRKLAQSRARRMTR